MKTTQSRFTIFGNITLALWLCLGGCGSALAMDLDPQLVGHWSGQGTGSITALAVSGNRAYVAQSESGLHVLDISDRANPAPVGSFATTTELHALALQSHRAYLAAGSKGLLIIDVSDSLNPRLVGDIKAGGKALDVAVSGHYAYVAEDATGLQVIDVSNPSAPRWVGDYEVTYSDGAGTRTVGAVGVTVVGENVCVAGGQAGLLIIDVSRPESPRLVATYVSDYSGRSSWGVDHNGTYVFAEFPFGIEIIDLSIPANPRKVSGPFGAEEYTFPGFAVCGDIVVMEESHLFDVSNPYEPRRVGFLGLEMWGNVSAAIAGSHLYVASSGNPGLNIFELRVANPQRIGSWPYGGIHDVFETYAFCESRGTPFQIVDFSDPLQPVVVGQLHTRGRISSALVAGDHVIALDLDYWDDNLPSNRVAGEGLLVINKSDIANPRAAGRIDRMHTWYSAHIVGVSGNYVFLENWIGGVRMLHIIDVSAPANPHEIHVMRGGTPALVGDFLYVPDQDQGLRIFDISVPADLKLIGEYTSSGGLWKLSVLGDLLYANSSEGAVLFDIADPSNVRFLALDSLRWPYRLPASPLWAFERDNNNHWEVISLADPGKPRRLGSLREVLTLFGFHVSGNYAYSQGFPGMEVFDITNPTKPRRVGGNSALPGGRIVATSRDGIIYANGYILQMSPLITSISRGPGGLELHWEGFGAARLQRTTSLTNPDWQEVIGLENTNRVTLPLRIGSEFFRLVRP